MAYFVLSPNGEESLNTFLNPDPVRDPGHLRGGPGNGNNTSVIISIGAIVFQFRVDIQTDGRTYPIE